MSWLSRLLKRGLQRHGQRGGSARAARSLVLWILSGTVVVAQESPKADPYGEGDDVGVKMTNGEQAAKRACTICHVFPEPSQLTKKSWREQLLPRMKVQLGVAKPDYSSSPEGELIRARKIYPDKPRIPVEDWPLIEEYYLSNAPEQSLPQEPHGEISLGLPFFRTEIPHWRNPTPLTTLVKISPASHRLFAGDDKENTLSILSAEGRLIKTLHVGNVPTDVVETEQGLYVVCIGSFQPSEVYRGELLFYPKQGDDYGEKKVLLKELPRPVQIQFADFNGDGKLDFALCMFGNLTGRFSWFENLGNDQYKEHVLSNKAGALTCVVVDFNGDGKPDIAVLMAQELEMLLIMINDGKGNFTSQAVFQKSPAYGHVYFEFADFNKDGKPDLLVVNGDNGEFESPLKNYHGIRIYLNKGGGEFEESFFYPINGCYKAMARDFDGDGNLDIAAISFFPDYRDSPRESFVFLRGEGGLKFKASTFKECIGGRWLVMDVGDLDGDGKPDIVLGSYVKGPSPVPNFLMDLWEKQGPSVQILRNLAP